MEKEKTVVDVPEVVNRAINAIARKLDTAETRGTIGDLLRLLQIREELAREQKQNGVVRAGWVSECRNSPNVR